MRTAPDALTARLSASPLIESGKSQIDDDIVRTERVVDGIEFAAEAFECRLDGRSSSGAALLDQPLGPSAVYSPGSEASPLCPPTCCSMLNPVTRLSGGRRRQCIAESGTPQLLLRGALTPEGCRTTAERLPAGTHSTSDLRSRKTRLTRASRAGGAILQRREHLHRARHREHQYASDDGELAPEQHQDDGAEHDPQRVGDS